MEPILTREEIARSADAAAQAHAASGNEVPPPNPYPIGSDAAAAWKASFKRQLLWHTAPDAEASA